MTIYGLHGTSLWAASRLVKEGWNPSLAKALATPRLRTPPDFIYAYWGETIEEVQQYLLQAQGWALEACERHPQPRPYAGAVLLLRVPREALRYPGQILGELPLAEIVAQGQAVQAWHLVCYGLEPAHNHPSPLDPASWPHCDWCWQPVLEWRAAKWPPTDTF
jgi:hypothetical protein